MQRAAPLHDHDRGPCSINTRARMTANSPARVAIPLTLSVPPIRQTDGEINQLAGATMGTTWSVKFVGATTDAQLVARAYRGGLDRVVTQMSPWEPASDLSRFNASAVASWQTLPAEFAGVIGCALRIAGETAGAYDPTMGALVDLWGFGPMPLPAHRPVQEAVDRARLACGWPQLEFDPASRRLRRLSAVRLDLNGIAKGFAVDLVASTLHAAGIRHALVEIGRRTFGPASSPTARRGGSRSAACRGRLWEGNAAGWLSFQLAIATSGSERFPHRAAGNAAHHGFPDRPSDRQRHARGDRLLRLLLHGKQLRPATALMAVGPRPAWRCARRHGGLLRCTLLGRPTDSAIRADYRPTGGACCRDLREIPAEISPLLASRLWYRRVSETTDGCSGWSAVRRMIDMSRSNKSWRGLRPVRDHALCPEERRNS